MAGVESIERNLDTEDAAYARELGGDAAPAAAREEMRIMAGGNVTVTSPPAKSVASVLTKAAIAAALLASGAGAGIGVPWALGMFDQPAAQKYELRLEVE